MSKLNEEQIQRLSNESLIMFNEGHVRIGQSFMNVLYTIDSDLYAEITATEYDCFYQDELVPKFIKYITNE